MTLKEALQLGQGQLRELKQELRAKAEELRELNAYVGFEESGDGVPVLVKDNISVEGWPVTCGSRILEGYVAPFDATAIANMRRHGFSPFGRANMDEFAMGSSTESSAYGPTRNPHDPMRVPGGSSGGSAAAVAAGIALAALGSDTGGSIRQPAAFCGIVGMKPTYGRVSRYGLVAYGSSLDQIGPMTQNVEDAAILYDALAGWDPKDSTSFHGVYEPVASKLDGSRKFRIAVVDDYIDRASEPVKKRLWALVDELRREGHTIIHKEMMDAKYDIAAYYITATAEAATNLQRFDGVRYGRRADNPLNLANLYIKSRSEGFGDEVKRRILLGNFVLSSGYYDAYYMKAQKVRRLIREEYRAVFADVDLLLMPVTPTTAFAFGSKKSPLEMYLEDLYTISLNLAGLPGISVPVGSDDDGMPIGVQLIADAWQEQTLFDGALSIEQLVH
ncbi:MAG: Asp-tRNA(Asn)/Glu-tRNA(Gln) amidotransferase subunit GatA [Campylobacterales bacterium]